jgi:hypothetical protein
MVEQWSPNISYRNYFDICAPKQCNYRQIQSSRIIDIITILISLYGGLSVVLRLIMPQVMKIFFKRKSLKNSTDRRRRLGFFHKNRRRRRLSRSAYTSTCAILQTHSKHVFKYNRRYSDQNHQFEYLAITIVQ